MRIACVSYRDWALSIYDELAKSSDHTFLIFRNKSQYNTDVLRDFKPDLVLFYGWSWYVPEDVLKEFKCLMLHPSPLPKYRGGSPLQNQIIAGEKKSQVSIFIMTQEMDAGDILWQEDVSLEGDLDSIFREITKIGISSTKKIIEGNITPKGQDHTKATFCKRRTPKESEITSEELKSASAEFLYNKIRMLADPYPNAYIKTADGKKLIITASKISDK